MRFDASYSSDTSAVFVTPGIALRWLADTGLSDFATVILDEFHERRWDMDLLAALLRRRGFDRASVRRDAASHPRVSGGRWARRRDGNRGESAVGPGQIRGNPP